MEKDDSILAAGIGGRFIINKPRWLLVSLLGFLFWSAVIASVRQVLALAT